MKVIQKIIVLNQSKNGHRKDMNKPRKNYILCPKNKEDEVKKYVGLMSGKISIKTYNDKNEVEF